MPEPLRAQCSLETRSKTEQLPSNDLDRSLLGNLQKYFSDDPYLFEACAADIVRMALGNAAAIDLTRRVRDGGRDAIGLFQIGPGVSGVSVDFAMKAKCYSPDDSIGVKELSRLISRLRHRQFGVMITTSWINGQAYQEIKDDKHPIVILSGGDTIQVLKSHGIATLQDLDRWLIAHFPREAASVGTAAVDA